MTTTISKFSLIVICLISCFACNKDEVKPATPTKSERQAKAKQLAKLKTELDMVTMTMFNKQTTDLTGGKIAKGVHPVSALLERAENMDNGRSELWSSGISVTIKRNDDGSTTFTFDYGVDGTEDNGLLIKGKVVLTAKHVLGGGEYDLAFDNFSQYPVDGDSKTADFTLNGLYKGVWKLALQDGITYTQAYEKAYNVTFPNGKQKIVSASGELAANLSGITITKEDFNLVTPSGEIFKATLTEPMFFDYSCFLTGIYTKGGSTYELNGETYKVDFGQGTCDNALTIENNGETITIDLGKIGLIG